MNERVNNIACVAPNEPTIKNLISESLEKLENLNEILSDLSIELYGKPCGNVQSIDVKCMNDAIILLLDRLNVALNQAMMLREGLI